eukprot:s2663_g16.t1
MTGRCRSSLLFRLSLCTLSLPLLLHHGAAPPGLAQVASPSQVLLERRSQLQAKKVAELKGMLRQKGLKVSGRKDDLVKRLLETVLEAELEPLELWRLSRVARRDGGFALGKVGIWGVKLRCVTVTMVCCVY